MIVSWLSFFVGIYIGIRKQRSKNYRLELSVFYSTVLHIEVFVCRHNVLSVYYSSNQGRREPTTRPGTKWRLVNTGPLSLSTLPLAIFNRNQGENCQRITCKKSPHNWWKRNVNDDQLTVFAEKTIEKLFISHLVSADSVQVGVFN